MVNWYGNIKRMGKLWVANQATRPDSNDSVVVVGSYDNFVHCIGVSTGKALWKFETQNYVNGVPTIYDRKYVVVGGCDSVLYVINLEDGNLVRSVEVEAPIAASVSVADGIGYVGNMEKAVCFRSRKWINYLELSP